MSRGAHLRSTVLIVGMHRSGTSALAGALAHYGMPFGDNLIPPDSENPKGYFEDVRIVKIHEQLLSAFGASWKRPHLIPEDWLDSEATKQAEDQLCEYIQKHLDQFPCFAIKDPRLCLLLPLWYRVLGRLDRRPNVILCLRQPDAIAQSLSRRNSMPESYANALFLQYLGRGIADLEATHLLSLVSYEDLLGDEMTAIHKVHTDLSKVWAWDHTKQTSWTNADLSHAQAIPINLGPVAERAHAFYRDILATNGRYDLLSTCASELWSQMVLFAPLLRELHERSAAYEEDFCQVYYKSEGKYSERSSVRYAYARGEERAFRFEINLESSSAGWSLRIDPSVYPGMFRLEAFKLYSRGGVSEDWVELPLALIALQASGDAKIIEINDHAVTFLSSGMDPRLDLPALNLPAGTIQINLSFKLLPLGNEQRAFGALCDDLDNLRGQNAQQKSDLTELSHTNGQLFSELDHRNKAHQELSGNYWRLDQQAVELRCDLRRLRAQKLSLIKERNNLSNDYSQVIANNHQLEGYNNRLNDELNEIRERFGRAIGNIHRLEDTINGLEDEVSGLEDRINSLQDRETKLLAENRRLNSQVESEQARVRRIRESRLWRWAMPLRALGRGFKRFRGLEEIRISKLEGRCTYSLHVRPILRHSDEFIVDGWFLSESNQPAEVIHINYDGQILNVIPVRRPDVAEFYADREMGSNRVGFVARGRFVKGPARICVEAHVGAEKILICQGKFRRAPRTLLTLWECLNPDVSGPLPHVTSGALMTRKVRFHLESYREHRLTFSENPIRMTGWAFDDLGRAAERVIGHVGDREIVFQAGVSRQDVSHAFEGIAPPNAGFEAEFRLGLGFKWIEFIAEWSDGSRYLLGRRSFWIRNEHTGLRRLWNSSDKETSRRIRHLRKLYESDCQLRAQKDATPDVCDVIVPVYRGLEETRLCLKSLYASRLENESSFEIVIINDQSPEPELSNWLKNEADAGRINLQCNESNLGFVGSVNRGMTLHSKRSVVLLNSDTEVYGDWLDRILRAAVADVDIATITPLSNNATICSYPESASDNKIPSRCQPSELDQMCREKNAGVVEDIPSGVGYCMYIRRKALDRLGYFDLETFGHGYGEENDFCQRAAYARWRNVALCDTFVYHKGAVSFQEAKNPKVQRAIAVLNALYPGYDRKVQIFLREDPIRESRFRLDRRRIEQLPSDRILCISNARSGGTLKHILDYSLHAFERQAKFLLRPKRGVLHRYDIYYLPDMSRLNFSPAGLSFDEIVDFCREYKITGLEFHHLVDQDVQIMQLPDASGLPFNFIAHDYYNFCPQITLTDSEGNYCGEPDLPSCEECLKRRPVAGIESVEQWRKLSAAFLSKAQSLKIPSYDAASRYLKKFSHLSFKVEHHIEDESFGSMKLAPRWEKPKGERLVVGVIGALSREKGADLLEAAAVDAAKKDLPIQFVLFGYAYRKLLVMPEANLIVTGPYTDENIDGLLEQYRPDLIWFPAKWPETYSYTLSMALSRQYPVVVPDLGAFPERIEGRRASWVLPWNITPEEVNQHFLECTEITGVSG